MAILGELDRAGLINRELPTVHTATLGEALDRWDIARDRRARRCATSSWPRRAACRRRSPSARSGAGTSSILDREKGVIRGAEHPFSKDGGLAVLNGNIALDGCIVKTAGVDESDPEILRPGAGLRKPGRVGQGAS